MPCPAPVLAAPLLLLPSAAALDATGPTARRAPEVPAKDVPHRPPPPSLRHLRMLLSGLIGG